MKRQTSAGWPDGWFDGKKVEPTYVYKATEAGEQKYKLLSNGTFVLKIKPSTGSSIFYIWDNQNDFYNDVKEQYPELKRKPS